MEIFRCSSLCELNWSCSASYPAFSGQRISSMSLGLQKPPALLKRRPRHSQPPLESLRSKPRLTWSRSSRCCLRTNRTSPLEDTWSLKQIIGSSPSALPSPVHTESRFRSTLCSAAPLRTFFRRGRRTQPS